MSYLTYMLHDRDFREKNNLDHSQVTMINKKKEYILKKHVLVVLFISTITTLSCKGEDEAHGSSQSINQHEKQIITIFFIIKYKV